MSAQLVGVSIPIMTRATHDPSSILDATEGEDDIVAAASSRMKRCGAGCCHVARRMNCRHPSAANSQVARAREDVRSIRDYIKQFNPPAARGRLMTRRHFEVEISVIVGVIVMLTIPAALAGSLSLTSGRQYSLCSAFEKNLQSFHRFFRENLQMAS